MSLKSNDGTKNSTLLNSIDGTDNGTKKVRRCSTAVLLYRGSAQLCKHVTQSYIDNINERYSDAGLQPQQTIIGFVLKSKNHRSTFGIDQEIYNGL